MDANNNLDESLYLSIYLVVVFHYIEINPPLVKNTGHISRESCKSGKQTSADARVCLPDLLVPREIFLVFLTKGRLIYILHLQKCPF